MFDPLTHRTLVVGLAASRFRWVRFLADIAHEPVLPGRKPVELCGVLAGLGAPVVGELGRLVPDDFDGEVRVLLQAPLPPGIG